MASLVIKRIPDPLLKWLRKCARQHHHSLNSEVLLQLERSVGAAPDDPEWFLTRVRALQEGADAPERSN